METTAWDRHAQWWQDGYTDGTDPEYVEQLIPMAINALNGCERTLDIGCGEGQVARALAASGHDIFGFDPTRAQVQVAVQRGSGPHYLQAFAESMPYRPASFDGAIACLVFEHLERYETVIGEIAAVLRPGGTFLLLLNHPLTQTPESAWIDDHILNEQYYRLGPYLVSTVWEEEIAPGVHLPYVHRPISHYVNALIACGFEIQRMMEPPPAEGFLAQAAEYEHVRAIPRVLGLLCRRSEDV